MCHFCIFACYASSLLKACDEYFRLGSALAKETFPDLPALFHKELICTKDHSVPSSTPSTGIHHLRGMYGERQLSKCSKARSRASLHSVDAEQILYAWQESDLSSAVHENVKKSEPQRNRKFEFGLHETHFSLFLHQVGSAPRCAKSFKIRILNDGLNVCVLWALSFGVFLI